MNYPTLFSPMRLRGLELKNRVILPAMETKMVTDDGCVTQRFIDYHVAIAKGGCGLNITEICAVDKSTHRAHFMALYTEDQMQEAKKLVYAVHDAGGKIAIQLWHGGMVISSLIPEGVKPMLTNDMSREEIAHIVKAFGYSAKLAVEAGFDSIEFHAAHSYLPHTFLSAAWNTRTDEYGGSLFNRARFALEVIDEIRRHIPQDMPLIMRVNSQDDYVENGLTREDIIAFINMAADHGVDLADISRGNAVTYAIKYEVPPIDFPRAYNAENVAEIKKRVKIPVMLVGRINAPDIAEEILCGGKADAVAIGRGQIADHEFCNKSMAGQEELIRKCVGCNQGCFDAVMDAEMPHITCMRNPFVGSEGEPIVKTGSPKKVLIAGGSLAGLEAAIILKQRGHIPIVYESSTRLGGQFLLAGRAPSKREMEVAARSIGEEALRAGIEINMMRKVTPELIDEIRPDELVIAVGAEPVRIDIPGSELPHVCNFDDVLAGRNTPSGRVVIIGAGLVGLEIAEYLSEKGAQCSVLARSGRVGGNLGVIRKVCVKEYLSSKNVKIIKKAACRKITKHEVFYEQDGEQKAIPCDHVVVAIGSISRDSSRIQEKAQEIGIPCYVAGDAVKARYAISAVAEGARIGVSIQ